MKKLLLLGAILVLCLTSCASPEGKAERILDNFTSSLSEITDAENMSPYELSSAINERRLVLEQDIKDIRKELTENEDMERFENALLIDDIDIYLTLREELASKNLAIIDAIKGKKWINSETGTAESRFTLGNNALSFLGLANNKPYSILNGDIVFQDKNGNCVLFFELKDNDLTIRNIQGETVKYREPKFNELILGVWRTSNYRVYNFKKNGISHCYLTLGSNKDKRKKYTINKNNVITHIDNVFSTGKIQSTDYIYNSKTDKLVENTENYPNSYYRGKNKGPESLSFLFDGKVKSVKKQEPRVKFSSKSSSSSNDWDSVLKEYEKFVNKYAKLYKKAIAGDMDALSEYAEYLESAERLQKKLDGAKNDLSVAQAKEFNRITLEFANSVL